MSYLSLRLLNEKSFLELLKEYINELEKEEEEEYYSDSDSDYIYISDSDEDY